MVQKISRNRNEVVSCLKLETSLSCLTRTMKQSRNFADKFRKCWICNFWLNAFKADWVGLYKWSTTALNGLFLRKLGFSTHAMKLLTYKMTNCVLLQSRLINGVVKRIGVLFFCLQSWQSHFCALFLIKRLIDVSSIFNHLLFHDNRSESSWVDGQINRKPARFHIHHIRLNTFPRSSVCWLNTFSCLYCPSSSHGIMQIWI